MNKQQARGIILRKKMMEAIIAYKRAHDGISPSMSEIAATLGVVKSHVSYHLTVLEDDGAISFVYEDGKRNSRAIMVTGGYWGMVGDRFDEAESEETDTEKTDTEKTDTKKTDTEKTEAVADV